MNYAKKKGIVVTNTPDVLTESTAELTIGLILDCCRRLYEAEKLIRDGKFRGWKPKLLLGTELKGKTVGIIGAGRIGSAVALRLKSFGTKIIYFDSKQKKDMEGNVFARKTSLNYLLKNSDIISIHIPLTGPTYQLLNKKNLCLIKKTSILINTSRGEIIDESYLIWMLKNNKLKSAGLDVFENEPIVNKEFLNLKNVIILPHIGSATIEARSAMAELAAKNVIAVLKKRKPITPV